MTLVSETNVSGTENISVPPTVPPDYVWTDEIGERSLGFATSETGAIAPFDGNGRIEGCLSRIGG